MITRDKDVNQSQETKILTICCEEVIEQQIIPELSLLYTIKINHYDDFQRYIGLIESVIKSAAIVQQLRQIKTNLYIDLPSEPLLQAIHHLPQQVDVDTKYTPIFELYYHDQPKINHYLISAESLFSHRTYIADLQYIIGLAQKGMSYTTYTAQYELPATYYCYTKQFNAQLLAFLQNIINDMYDTYNKKLYRQYNAMPISEEAFSSIITTLAFRLQLAVQFIAQFYAAQTLIEENSLNETGNLLDTYFLQLVGNIRSHSLAM